MELGVQNRRQIGADGIERGMPHMKEPGMAEDDVEAEIRLHGRRVVGGVPGAGVDQVVAAVIGLPGVDGRVGEACIGKPDIRRIDHAAQFTMVTEDQVAVRARIDCIGLRFTQPVTPDAVGTGTAEGYDLIID